MWVASAYAGLCAGWLEFSWWQFVLLAGSVVVAIKLGACVLASWWYRGHLAMAPRMGEQDDAGLERWSNGDRGLASRWLGQAGWMEVMPMDYDFPFVDWSNRVQTFVPWALAQFTIAGLVWGTVMWLVRATIGWTLG